MFCPPNIDSVAAALGETQEEESVKTENSVMGWSQKKVVKDTGMSQINVGRKKYILG